MPGRHRGFSATKKKKRKKKAFSGNVIRKCTLLSHFSIKGNIYKRQKVKQQNQYIKLKEKEKEKDVDQMQLMPYLCLVLCPYFLAFSPGALGYPLLFIIAESVE